MDPVEPAARLPQSSRAGAGDPAAPISPAGRDFEANTKPDPAATITFRPSGSGIAPALGDGAAVVVLDIDKFARELTDNGLVETAEVEALRQQVLAREGPRDATALASELVRYGRLTAYQAAAVLQAKTKGLLIGNYDILDKLGAGSMGMVFKARHRRLKRMIALKLLPPSLAKDPSAVLRFQREAKAAAKLSHPNVVAVLDADEFRGLHFLVMEYVAGRDLARLVREEGPMPFSQAIDCIIQAARGLKAAFDASVVHRDIKPSNLLLGQDGRVKILDMGLARVDRIGGALADASLTQSNVLLGTVDYMSPEQASNPRNADHRSDIYSLGCTLHYLLTGRSPFAGDTLIERLIAHREQPIPRLAGTRPDLPAALDGLMARVLAKAPGDRFSSLDELILALEACQPGAGNAAVAGPASAPAGERPARSISYHQRRTLAVVSSVAAGVGLLLLGIYISRPGPARTGQKDAPSAVESTALAALPKKVSEPEPRKPPERPVAADLRKQQVKAITKRLLTNVAPSTNLALPREAVGVVREFRGHAQRVNSVAVAGDNQVALTGGHDRTVRLWDVATGRELRRAEHGGPVEAVAMSALGRSGLSGSDDKTVGLWDFQSDHDLGLRRLLGHTGAVFAVAFASGDQIALSGGADKTVRIWNVATAGTDGPPLVHDGAVICMATSSGDSVLTGCDDGTIWLWDLSSRQRIRRLKAPGPVLCLAWSPLGHRSLSGHADGVLVLWDLDLGTEIGRMVAHGDYIRSAAFLPDGRRALVGSQFGPLILWDVEARRELERLPHLAAGPDRAGQMGIAILADGLHALTADTDACMRLWRLPAGDTSNVAAGVRATP